jgi:hypothetical protein
MEVVFPESNHLTTSKNNKYAMFSRGKESVDSSLLNLIQVSGKIGYRIHNFNVIPKELKSAGQSIQADPTDDKLSIRITRTGGEEITISSPTSKKSLAAC